jgi:hypothetical protein
VPTGLKVASTGDGRVVLDWNDNTGTFGHYQVYRDDKLISDGPAVSSYTDTGLTNGQAYSYRVGAGADPTYSAWTSPVSASPTGPAPTPGPGSGPLPPGLTVAIRPQVGHAVSEYFAYVNGKPPAGRSAYISSDLGLPALRADGALTDPPSVGDYAPNIHRNQVGGAKRVDGGIYTFPNGQTAYHGLRIKFGPKTNLNAATWTTFVTWTSFDTTISNSGPFQLTNDGHFNGHEGLVFQDAFGIANPFYGTSNNHDHVFLPFPSEWMDVLIGVHYSTSWSDGWLELSWKWATEPVSAFRAMKFPVYGDSRDPVRYITRTYGGDINDNRFGPYSGAALDVQEALADFFVAPNKQTVLDALTAIGTGN